MPESNFPIQGTLLGLDFGLKRIGVATGHTKTLLSHPHSTIVKHSGTELPATLFSLVKEWKPSAIIVGYPTHADARQTTHPLYESCLNFAYQLAETFSLPVGMVDEQLSSYEAEVNYHQQHKKAINKHNKSILDAYAAQCILQDFLNGSPASYWINLNK